MICKERLHVAETNLLIQTAFVGDLLLTIPLMRWMRRSAPPADRLALFCRKGLGNFFLHTGMVDQLFEVDKTNSSDWRKVKKELQDHHFQTLVSAHQSFRTATIVASLNAHLKIGYQNPWSFWAYDVREKRPMHLPEALRLLALARKLNSELEGHMRDLESSGKDHQIPSLDQPIPPWSSLSLSDFVEDPSTLSVQKVLQILSKIRTPFVCFAPGSVWETKCWTTEGYAQLGQSFHEMGYTVVLLGSEQERVKTQAIAAKIPESLDLSGQTNLFESFLVLRRGSLAICNDNGGMHLACAANTPTVGIFGPTVLKLGYRPWSSRSLIVEKDHSCRPCGKHGSAKCPIGTHVCMTSIQARDVLEVCRKLLV